MEKFVKGDIVVIPFPFSDLTQTKKRPALVLTSLKGDDLILCQITSQKIGDSYAIYLTGNEFKEGTLDQDSNIRPNKIFTADNSIIDYKIGSLKKEKTNRVIEKVCEIIKN
ncbi:MAG: type II toxin-antitoxin system PemK/MazF family toxin [archaeon]